MENLRTRPSITLESMDYASKMIEKKNEQKTPFDATNYLNTTLSPSEKEKTLTIRLLPVDSKKNQPFEVVHMHRVKLNPEQAAALGMEWKSYTCLRHPDNDIDHSVYGDECPFCQLYKQAYKNVENAKTEEEKKRWKEIAREYRPVPTGILRCIERGDEKNGPKFWKFYLRNDKTDPMGLILNVYEDQKDEVVLEDGTPYNMFDTYSGKDLKVKIKKVVDSRGKATRNITVFPTGAPKPILPTEEEIDKVICDEKKWSDVFPVKPYDYLHIIVNEGKVPFFDKQLKKWVAKDEGIPVENKQAEELKYKIEEATRQMEQAASAQPNATDDAYWSENPFV